MNFNIKYGIVFCFILGAINFNNAQNNNKTKKKVAMVEKQLDSPKINWLNIDVVQKLNKEKPKKIFIDFYTSWCGPCRLLDKNTFSNKDVVKYVNENYYAVKFNAEGKDSLTFKNIIYKNPNYREGMVRNHPHEFSLAMGIQAYPTVVFLDEQLNTITPVKGYIEVPQFELYLKFFNTNDYKKVTNKKQWDEYQNNFKYEFKN